MSSTASTPPQAPTAVPQVRTSGTTARRPSFRMRAIQVAIPTVQTSAYIQSSAATPRYWLDNSAPLASSPSIGSPADCTPCHGHPACACSGSDAPATPTQPRMPVSARATRKDSVYSSSPMDGAAEMRSLATASGAVMNSPMERNGDGEECSNLSSMASSRAPLPVDESGEDSSRLVKLARRRHGWYEQWWRDAGRGHGQTNAN